MKKILFVDDEEHLRGNVQRYLELNEFEVILANDGAEGLEMIKKEKPDLVITDVMMPRMDGFTMLREIKSSEAMRDIPVIMLTAKESIRDLYEMQGASDFIPKPFDMGSLLDAVNKALLN